jgi:hypothetical protein
MEKENENPELTIPFILRIAFEYDPATLSNANNKIKCRGCEKQLLFGHGSRTSNLISHLRDTNNGFIVRQHRSRLKNGISDDLL